MTTFPNVAVVLAMHLLIAAKPMAAVWCVARNDASVEALQNALDYACGAGADCAPVQKTGACFVPDTVQAHASYAFNSYYMHSSMDPAACDFAGTATIAKTDPSYGSCVYPASPIPFSPLFICNILRNSTAGGMKNPPLDTAVPAPQDGSGGALTPPADMNMNFTAPMGNGGALTPPGMAPAWDNTPPSEAFSGCSVSRLLVMGMMLMVFFLMF